MSDDIMALNELTGRAHQYKGTAPGGVGSGDDGLSVGIIPCGCDDGLFAEAVKKDQLTVINERHLEAGVWERATCLRDDADGEREGSNDE